jgi:CheY-like chemotaxis protein
VACTNTGHTLPVVRLPFQTERRLFLDCSVLLFVESIPCAENVVHFELGTVCALYPPKAKQGKGKHLLRLCLQVKLIRFPNPVIPAFVPTSLVTGQKRGTTPYHEYRPMKKILIVEDDLKIARSIALRLEAQGYDVLTAANGCDGLFETLENRPDVIVMDIMMPNGLGFSVAQRLRSLGFGRIPIIFITASKLQHLDDMARNLGAFAFVEKPFEAKELLDVIAKALKVLKQNEEPVCAAA